MLFFLLILLVYLALAAVLFGVSRFIQGIFYLEVPPTLWWRALIAAGVIWVVALVWPVLFNQAEAGRWPISFDDMLFLKDTAQQKRELLKELVVVDESNRQTRYRRATNQSGLIEFRNNDNRPLPLSPPVLIAVPEEGEGRRLTIVKDKDGYIDRSSGSAVYEDPDGERIAEASFYTGTTVGGGYGQFFLTLFGDLVIFVAWFLVLWLILLFQWQHALLIALPAFFIWGLAMNLVV
jgi:hypothetical protein